MLHEIYNGNNVNNFVPGTDNGNIYYSIFVDDPTWFSNFDGLYVDHQLETPYEYINMHGTNNIYYFIKVYYYYDNYNDKYNLYIKYNNVYIRINLGIGNYSGDCDCIAQEIIYDNNMPDLVDDNYIYICNYDMLNRFKNIVNYYSNNNYSNTDESDRIIDSTNPIYSSIEPLDDSEIFMNCIGFEN